MSENKLRGKKIYAFGDSIVYGHTLPEKSFMRIIAQEQGVDLTMCAVNGASIIRSDNHILTQVENGPAEMPDLILFDGYTNDAYERFMDRLGRMIPGDGIQDDCDGVPGENSEGEVAEPDDTTFCGGFEKIVQTMQKRWPGVPIYFVTIHKSSGRDWDIQCKLRELSMAICKKYGVNIIDVFAESSLDTRDEQQLKDYIIGQAGSHPNEAACRTYYVPLVLKALGTK